MKYELEPSGYEKNTSCICPLSYNLAIESIIQGYSEARIFVDDKASPRSTITWVNHQVYLAVKLITSLSTTICTP